MATIYLALGSNLGNRLEFLHKALEELKQAGVKVLKLSTVIETDPVGGIPQGRYLNAVLKAFTILSAEELIQVTQTIERKLGRVKKTLYGPRVIDIDILLYEDIKLISKKLMIPHPRMFERSFVMQPLNEIAPELCASLKL